MSMDTAVYGERLRTQLRDAPDRWHACAIWAAVLVLRHSYLQPDAWDRAQRLGAAPQMAAGATALAAAALRAAAAGGAERLEDLVLDDAAEPLADPDTAKAAVRAAGPLPRALDTLQGLLDAIVLDLDHADPETREENLYVLGLAHQALAPTPGRGPGLGDQLPSLAQTGAMTAALETNEPGTAPYEGAIPLGLHQQLAALRESATGRLALDPAPRGARERDALLDAAALADRWLLAWGPEDQPAQRVARADALANALRDYDITTGVQVAGDARAHVRATYLAYGQGNVEQ